MAKIVVMPLDSQEVYCIDMETRAKLRELIDSLAGQQDAGIKFMGKDHPPMTRYQCCYCGGFAPDIQTFTHRDYCPITLMRELAKQMNL